MYPDAFPNFVQKWPEFAPKIVEKASQISKSPALAKFLLEEAGNYLKLQKKPVYVD